MDCTGCSTIESPEGAAADPRKHLRILNRENRSWSRRTQHEFKTRLLDRPKAIRHSARP